MTRRMKAYLPRWVRWIVFPMLGLVWAVITYVSLDEIGVAAWAGVSLVLVLVGVMLWLMTSGRLPAYIVEIDDTEDSRSRDSH
jgi:hypothetical protein